jgi:hypothetical protein
MGACSSRAGLTVAQRDLMLEQFKQISAEMKPGPMMKRSIDAMLSLLPVERATVFVVDRHAGVMRTFNQMEVDISRATTVTGRLSEIRGSSELEEKERVFVQKPVTIPIDSGIAGACVASAQSEIVADAQRDARFNKTIDERTGFRTRNIICVPVKRARNSALDADDGRRRPGATRKGRQNNRNRAATRRGGSPPRKPINAAPRPTEPGGAAFAEGSERTSSGTEEVVAVLQALNHKVALILTSHPTGHWLDVAAAAVARAAWSASRSLAARSPS